MSLNRLTATTIWTTAVLITVVGLTSLLGCSDVPEPSPAVVTTVQPSISSDNIKITKDVVYGSNKDITGKIETLKLDVYAPTVKTDEKLPLIILLGGGGFLFDTDKSQYSEFAPELARHGFVVACCNYRVMGETTFPTADVIRTVIIQGMQDAKASVRFFREDAAINDTYNIDPNNIFLGGFSAGAMVTGHAVYLDDIDKADQQLKKIIQAEGGLEGNSGHPGYDSSVRAWIDMAGALLDKQYITAGSKPMLGIYGSKDTAIPPGDSNMFLKTRIDTSGTLSLFKQALAVGVQGCALFPIRKGEHTAPVKSNKDQCIMRIVAFIRTLK